MSAKLSIIIQNKYFQGLSDQEKHLNKLEKYTICVTNNPSNAQLPSIFLWRWVASHPVTNRSFYWLLPAWWSESSTSKKKQLSRPDFNEAPNNPSANEPESLPTCSGIRVHRIIFIFESDVAMGSKPVSAKCVTDHLK